jgi:hypothetical protein
MIAAHTDEAREAGMVLALGIREDGTTQRIITGIIHAGVACGSCGTNYATISAYRDPEFRDAAGCGLCVPCFTEAGIENEHADGYHEGAPDEGCADCNGGINAGVDGGAWAE